MINCPNCNKEMNERFEYCRICGSKLNGEDLGDYSTEINNLFKDEEGYYYLFAVNGKQLIFRNEDKEELKNEILLRNYPWIEIKDLKRNQSQSESSTMKQTPKKQEAQNESQITENQETQNKNQIREKIQDPQNESQITEIREHDQKQTEKKDSPYFDEGFNYVTKEEDVNFGKIRYYDPESGQGCETWGPDNSERAKNLRKKIIGKYV